MKARILQFLALAVAAIALHGCGGGSSDPKPAAQTPAPAQATVANVKLSTAGAGSSLSGVQVTVTLPDGVTVKATDGIPDAGVVKISGVAPANATLGAHYVPATATTPGQIMVLVASTVSFPAGEFATITCDVAAGKTLSKDMLTFTDYRPVDGSGRSVLAEYPTVTADVVVN